jgi:hypothetical protein
MTNESRLFEKEKKQKESITIAALMEDETWLIVQP